MTKHQLVDASTNIVAASNIAVQAYEHSRDARQFTSKPKKTAALDVNQFALLSSYYILSLLLVQPKMASETEPEF